MSLLLALVGGFASGVVLRSLFVFGWSVFAFVLLLALIFAVGFLLWPRRAYALAALFLAFVFLGMLRTVLAEQPLPKVFAADLHHRVTYLGTVSADPDLRDATERIPLRVTKSGVTTGILVVTSRSVTATVGDRVQVTGTLLMPRAFATKGGRTFRYDSYLEKSGIRFIMDYASLRVRAPAPWYSVSAFFARGKHVFLRGLEAALPEPYASLAGGIVIGGKSGLGITLQNAFVQSGLVQIIVLSGYNVVVVAEWVMAALAFVQAPPRIRAAAGAIALLLFVGVAGTSATAVRAAIMACIALYARATGRSYAAGRALLVTVFFMLLYNPLFAAFDPGFDLSVAATAGLIWLAPLFEARLTFVKNAFWKNAVATTLAAQTAVLPLLLYETGNLSLIAIPANLLVMPFVPATMLFSAFAGLAGMLFGSLAPLLASLLALPAYLLTAGLILVAEKSVSLPYAAFTLPAFPFWLTLLAYVGLASYAIAAKRSSAIFQEQLAKKAST